MTLTNTPRICFIGFGEAGQALAAGLRGSGVAQIAAWDILFAQESGSLLRGAATKIGARQAASAQDAVSQADIVLAAVTAASSLDAAVAAKPYLRPEQFYLDINSVSPGRKQDTAEAL